MNDNSVALPLVQCFAIESAEPSLEDNTADIDRLRQSFHAVLESKGISGKQLQVPYSRMAGVAADFRSAGFSGFVLANILPAAIEVVDFYARAPSLLPAVALDLGTTHIEATLLNLQTGARLFAAHRENRQLEYGSDILARIHHAAPSRRGVWNAAGSEGLEQLRKCVIDTINELIADLAVKGKVLPQDIRAMSVSGNTTMIHLFLGLDPYNICREPYIPLVNDPDPCHGAELGLDISPLAPVWILPSIGSYFGGDLISGILACKIDQSDEICMLIDVGTNAEVVLGNKDWLIACAGAAGPALEGGVAKMGMRASPGAVEHVAIDTGNWTLKCKTIDAARPAGICGSGLIDLVAQLYLSRIIDFRGKFREDVVPGSPNHKQFLQRRLRRDESGLFFVLALPEETCDGNAVILSQVDLDAMMRSKAAMYAILTTLVSQVGVGFEELHKIYIAGAFGKHIDPHHAITLGMLPDLPLSKYKPIGNSSLLGAEMVLMSEEHRIHSRKIRHIITYIELNVNQEFMIRFSGSRFIPHTEPALFPSVPVFRDVPER